MLAILALVSLLVGSAYGGFGFGPCLPAVSLPNFNISQFGATTWYIAGQIPMLFENTNKMCAMHFVSPITPNTVNITSIDYNTVFGMPEMSTGIGNMNNNISNSFMVNMTMPIFAGITMNNMVHYDIMATDNTGYALIHICQDLMGFFKNDGYMLLTSQPNVDPNTLQTAQNILAGWGVDVTQAVMFPPYNNTMCAMMMTMMPNMATTMAPTMTTANMTTMLSTTTPMMTTTTSMMSTTTNLTNEAGMPGMKLALP